MKPLSQALVVILTAMAIAAPAFADRDYREKRGYRERPYDKHRHYDHRDYRGKKYAYQGHWRSWDDWHRYYHGRPWLRDGRYYRDDGHLMFRFCDPGGGGCFFFSIGR